MAPEHQPTYAEKLGVLIVRAWHSYLRGENAVLAYLRSRGSVEERATLGVWLLRMVLAGLLIALLPAAVIAVVIVIAAVLAFSSGKADPK